MWSALRSRQWVQTALSPTILAMKMLSPAHPLSNKRANSSTTSDTASSCCMVWLHPINPTQPNPTQLPHPTQLPNPTQPNPTQLPHPTQLPNPTQPNPTQSNTHPDLGASCGGSAPLVCTDVIRKQVSDEVTALNTYTCTIKLHTY